MYLSNVVGTKLFEHVTPCVLVLISTTVFFKTYFDVAMRNLPHMHANLAGSPVKQPCDLYVRHPCILQLGCCESRER